MEESITATVRKALDDCAPDSFVSRLSKWKPWVSAFIRSLMQARNAASSRAKKTALTGDIIKYGTLRNQVSNSLDSANNAYISSSSNSSSDLKTKWRTLREIAIAFSFFLRLCFQRTLREYRQQSST